MPLPDRDLKPPSKPNIVVGKAAVEPNPKDKIGSLKTCMSYVPEPVLMELALAMMEGMKYGRHNYRVIPVRASSYYDAARRHLAAWWEGEDLDPESKVGLHHISKAIATFIVIRDAMMHDCWIDDRPPRTKDGWLLEMNKKAKALCDACENPIPPYTEKTLK